ncbi:hypothetical protein Fmac_004652 [Flemingia macrophylla]|uniref:Myb-like protein X n=1 Tax=Flemingia macrophylla TaxID=520843 RepID=A0ABD1N6H7_9FABA
MSRCFPFPPPGYVKKATDEGDLLRKEKQKEKKHKKDKRDKEKRESKEKREKEGRDGKHKEKKDKKEKRKEKKKDRDKDKDKSKDRDKSKISTADDKGFPRQAEGPNASKIHQKEIKQDDKKGILFENRLTKQYTDNNGEKAREKNHLVEDNKESKFLLEFDRRIRVGDGGASNQLVHKFTNTDHRKDEGSVRLVAKGGGTWPDGNEKLKDKVPDAKKMDGREIQAEGRPIGNATVQNHTGNLHPRVDGIPKLMGKYFERNSEATIEGKEKVKEKKDEQKEKTKEKAEGKVKEKKDEAKEKVKEKKDDKRRDKKKDKEKEKKGHGKDKDRDKEKKKEEKAKEHSELKTTEQSRLKESNKIGIVDSSFLTQLSMNNPENAVSGVNLKKRKDSESNGVPHVYDNRPNKLPRLSSTHPFSENGKILETCQISIPNASHRPGVAASVKVENKECKINGFVEAQPFAASSNKTHTATVPALLVNESSAKPPHPDTKYLSQVYSVPKVEHWSDFDDHEWLFGSNVSHERKSVFGSSEVGETPQVWAEALHIEQADVFALPYVIPY